MKVKEYKKIAYGEWFDFVDGADAKRAHARNVERCHAAIKQHQVKNRKLNILVVHGSGRSSFMSSANELSNSQLLLKSALQQFEHDQKYEITEVRLRDYNISPCNGCYSTTSSLCGFPCNCFPLDPMQELYPLVLRCDVMFCSTGVNQSAMSSRLKLFVDRLISPDGGFYVAPAQFKKKDADWRDRCLALSAKLGKDMPYDPRMWGRVAAYFISSKDQNNELKTIAKPKGSPLSYIEAVAWSLWDGFSDYGFFHADPWYAGAAANPDEDMAFDKARYEQSTKVKKQAARVAASAVALAIKYRKHPPAFDGGARRNRT